LQSRLAQSQVIALVTRMQLPSWAGFDVGKGRIVDWRP